MNFCTDIPEIYFKITKVFPDVDWNKGIAIAFGETVYAKYPLRADVASHEEIHIYQQKDHLGGPVGWWKEYLTDKNFRLAMEKEAYQYQVKYIRKAVKDRNLRYRLIHQCALDLSGTMYDNMCTHSEALEFLKEK